MGIMNDLVKENSKLRKIIKKLIKEIEFLEQERDEYERRIKEFKNWESYED